MRLSRESDQFHSPLCQHDRVGITGSSGAYRNDECQTTLNPCLVQPSLGREWRVDLSEAPRGLSRLAPGIRSSPPRRASPAGRTRTRTSPAKSYSPGIAWFPECRAPAATWPAVHRSSPDDPVRHAIFPWPHAPSRETTSGFLSAQQTSSRSREIKLPYMGFTSHIWDFIADSTRFRTSATLYQFSCSSRQGESCEARSRQRNSAGADLGGNRGNKR